MKLLKLVEKNKIYFYNVTNKKYTTLQNNKFPVRYAEVGTNLLIVNPLITKLTFSLTS